MRKATALAAAILALLAFAAPARADSFPHTSVDLMCDRADLIIEGRWLGDDKVSIASVLKPSADLPEGTKEINVRLLGKHSRRLGCGWEKEAATLEAKHLVGFLEKGAEGWQSLYTIDAEGACGSCGLFWFDDQACYGYGQFCNPGPYVLSRGHDGGRTPKDLAALRKEIAAGLGNSRRWREALAVKDPAKKARALAAYLLPRTSPPGDKGSYRWAVREPLRELGDEAVPALVEVIESARPDDKLDGAVLVLYDLGPKARSAVPLLCKLLDAPKQADASYILSALETAGDPRAIGSVRPLLGNEDFSVAVRAAQTLAALKDRESFEAIAALIPEKPEKARQYYLRDLLNALHRLDPERARPLVRKAAGQPALADVREQIDGLKDAAR